MALIFASNQGGLPAVLARGVRAIGGKAFQTGVGPVLVTVRIGRSCFGPWPEARLEPNHLLSQADTVLHRVTQKGDNP
jgi:hypothetical protein